MNDRFKSFIEGISFFGLTLGVGALLVVYGAIENDSISMSSAIKYGVITLVLISCSTFGLIRAEKEEDVYGRL